MTLIFLRSLLNVKTFVKTYGFAFLIQYIYFQSNLRLTTGTFYWTELFKFTRGQSRITKKKHVILSKGKFQMHFSKTVPRESYR